MNRGATSQFKEETEKPQNMPVHLVSIHLDTITLYMNDSYKTITYMGNDYLAVGYFMGFSDIEESSELIVSSISLSLSGIDKTMISLVLDNNHINRTAKIYKAFLDPAHVLVIDPILIFEGQIASSTIDENPDNNSSTVTVSVANSWANFGRKTGRHANHEEQQVHFPGDKGFEFASQNVENLIWGKKPETAPQGSSSGQGGFFNRFT